jgi:hypothetical protein
MSPEQSPYATQGSIPDLPSKQQGFVFESEEDRLLKDALRPAMEKLQLFTKMLRRNAMLTHLHPQQKTQ